MNYLWRAYHAFEKMITAIPLALENGEFMKDVLSFNICVSKLPICVSAYNR